MTRSNTANVNLCTREIYKHLLLGRLYLEMTVVLNCSQDMEMLKLCLLNKVLEF
jgi:hypothetical protein